MSLPCQRDRLIRLNASGRVSLLERVSDRWEVKETDRKIERANMTAIFRDVCSRVLHLAQTLQRVWVGQAVEVGLVEELVASVSVRLMVSVECECGGWGLVWV